MPNLNRIAVSLPPDLKNYVEKKVETTGEFASESDYIRQLVREDRAKERELERIRAAVREGIAQAEAGQLRSEAETFDPLLNQGREDRPV
jgi:putative addiction module CopG family antidote